MKNTTITLNFEQGGVIALPKSTFSAASAEEITADNLLITCDNSTVEDTELVDFRVSIDSSDKDYIKVDLSFECNVELSFSDNVDNVEDFGYENLGFKLPENMDSHFSVKHTEVIALVN